MEWRSQAGSTILLYSALEGLPDLHISGMWNANSCRAVTMSTKNPASSRLGSCTSAWPTQTPKLPCHLGGTTCLGGGGGKELLSCHRDTKVKKSSTSAASLLPRHEIAATGEIQHAQPAGGVLGSCVITVPSSHMTRRAPNVTCCMCETASPMVAQRCEVSPMAAAHLTDHSAATLE